MSGIAAYIEIEEQIIAEFGQKVKLALSIEAGYRYNTRGGREIDHLKAAFREYRSGGIASLRPSQRVLVADESACKVCYLVEGTEVRWVIRSRVGANHLAPYSLAHYSHKPENVCKACADRGKLREDSNEELLVREEGWTPNGLWLEDRITMEAVN